MDALLVDFGPVCGASRRGPTPQNHAGAYTGARFRKNRDFPLELLLGSLLGSPKDLSGTSWDPLGLSWGPLGALLGPSWALWERSGDALGTLLGRSGALLGNSWGALGRFLALLDSRKGPETLPRASLGRFWGPIWRRLCEFWGCFGEGYWIETLQISGPAECAERLNNI